MADFHSALLLENIRSLLNVGAMFRSCDGAGVERIILTGYTPTPPRPEISKTALGAEESVIWEWYQDPSVIIQSLRDEGVQILALEKTEDSIDIFEFVQGWSFVRSQPWCLIVGNEVAGVSSELLQLCDAVVHLPMRGIKWSLNVATAATTAMYVLMSSDVSKSQGSVAINNN